MIEDVLATLTDQDALTMTALGEARGDGIEGGSSIEERLAVMLVVRNRLSKPARFGSTYKSVCLQPRQFSCWNPDDPNRVYLLGMDRAAPLTVETRRLAQAVMDGVILDFTRGATHYYSPHSMKPMGAIPAWAKGVEPCAKVGSSLYFKGV